MTMTVQVNIAQAKAKLSELITRAEAGEEVVIARSGKPAVKLTVAAQHAPVRPPRKLGVWDHLNLDVPDDLFIGPDEETLAAMDEPVFPPRA